MRIPYSQENYDILLQEMQSMSLELERVKAKTGQLTSANFELDQSNKKLTLQNDHLKGINEKLEESLRKEQKVAKAATVMYNSLKHQNRELEAMKNHEAIKYLHDLDIAQGRLGDL
jgi:regulator of replication initiation timing